MPQKMIDMRGQRIGRLTVLSRAVNYPTAILPGTVTVIVVTAVWLMVTNCGPRKP